MKKGHDREWQDENWPHEPARPNLLARLLAPANRLLTGNLGRIARWSAGIAASFVLCLVALYVAFLTGLLSVDVATPWIVSALEEKLPPGHKVFIGRTKLDYDSAGAPVLTAERLEIKNDRNEQVLLAPSAEVGLETGSLLMGNYRVRRVTLIGAIMTVRLDEQGNIKVSTPKEIPSAAITTAPVPRAKHSPAPPQDSNALKFPEIAEALARLERTGIDGIALAEIGLDRGTLVVESDTPGRAWKFENINFSLRRPAAGGIAVRLSSGLGINPWEINASIGAAIDGVRSAEFIADRVVPNDLINAAGYGDLDLYANTPVSSLLQAKIGVDGTLISANLGILVRKGEIGNASDERGRFEIDEAQVTVRFDPARRLFVVDPFRIGGGQNRVLLGAVIEPPKAGTTIWNFAIPQGAIALGTGRANEPSLSIDQVMFRGHFDPLAKKLLIDEGVLRGRTAGLALSGGIDLGSDTPTLQLGIAADRMPVSALKRLWPAPVAPGTRTWVLEHVESGVVDRTVIGLNLPLAALAEANTKLPDESMKIEIQASAMKFTPIAGLPPIADARAEILVTGQNAHIKVINGVVDLGRKRRLLIPEGSLQVPNHYLNPPTGIIQMRIEGSGEAVADFLSREMLKNEIGFTPNPETTRGQVVSNVRIELPFKREILKADVAYAAEAEFSNMTVENIIRGQKIESGSGKLTFTGSQVIVKGEGKIGGANATFEYMKPRGKPDADFRVATTLDEAARKRFGIELSQWLTGPMALRVQGTTNDSETRVQVDADLTAATITELIPGWNKLAGRPARAVFKMTERDGALKLEDISVTGSGVNLKGSVELDAEFNIVSANFPTFHLNEGDRATLTVDRNETAMRVTVRGTVLDARGLIRSLSDTPTPGRKKEKARDTDIDVRIGAATGHNGEVIRNLELRAARRNGEIRSFALLGRIGRDSSIVGELRARDGGRQVVYITAGDAGALFRFADYYSKIQGGEIWIVLDTPTADNAPQEGIVSVRNFNIMGEAALDRLLSTGPALESDRTQQRPVQQRGGAVPFVRMRIDFTRTPGRFTIKEAIIFGPSIGATVDGVLDYAQNEVRLRGTYVPAFGINNFFGQIPVLGLFLGGPKEGVFALTFEIVGPASGPTLRINPMSMAAPGFFRKIFEFRGANDTAAPFAR